MKKICFITTSRADFGMVNTILDQAKKYKKKFQIFLIVSGNHDDKFFGESINEIKINKKIKKLRVFSKQRNIDSCSVAISFTDFMKKYSLIFKKLKPSIFVVFGDRYEMLAATLSAFIQKIPVAHIAGGEKTSGSLDDNFRHSITKFSNLHFPTSQIYKKRIVQLGENPNTVFNYGSLNRQKIALTKFISREALEKKYKLNFFKRNILMTLHPENVGSKVNVKNLKIVLNSLNNQKNTGIIVTSPNADAEGVEMIKFIKKFVKNKKRFRFIKSLGTVDYLSILKLIDGVIGNSSSGISEVPLFSINTINLGDRQNGREAASTVINCKIDRKEISRNLKKLKRKKNLIKINYRDKFVAKKILNKIINFNFKRYNNKFYDIKFNI